MIVIKLEFFYKSLAINFLFFLIGQIKTLIVFFNFNSKKKKKKNLKDLITSQQKD